MVLADDFKTLLNIGKQLVTDPAVKQAISDDIATLEAKAEAGVEAIEQHVADWFHAHYQLPAPASDASDPAATGTDAPAADSTQAAVPTGPAL